MYYLVRFGHFYQLLVLKLGLNFSYVYGLIWAFFLSNFVDVRIHNCFLFSDSKFCRSTKL